ncbi:acyl-CoA N-acyltransferase [Annulohypoxylon truncatum]|uniref:acyl-CoA N-acyltransferase n=1 Tax=Annulohypoxylon truncatum TaxID=327061 RepID=UPI002008EADB|nr:acyl-CoA N-acyltransferase [Annulohypoxylon truncatum]KAI1209803.1 acyl-CoA N-acyltransferase [Annulohypoxylon truncatum]
MGDAQALFSASLISPDIIHSLPDGFAIRPLERGDYGKGFFDCLRVLTWVGDVSEVDFIERFDEMVESTGTYYFAVIEHENRIVGTGALVIEKKFIHGRGKCGHIEEISVAKEHQGKGLGLKMIRALDSVAVNLGCYKNILNCGLRNEPFYVKCGYHNSGIEMSRYFEAERDDYHRG